MQRQFIQSLVWRESATHHLHFGRETQRQAEGWERLIVERKGGFMCALTGGCWPGEAVGRLIRSGASFVVS